MTLSCFSPVSAGAVALVVLVAHGCPVPFLTLLELVGL
jgi:hypothetical protein